MRVMATPKYSDELRKRATRMAVELRRDPATRNGAIQRVAEQLGIHPESLRLGEAGRGRRGNAAGHDERRRAADRACGYLPDPRAPPAGPSDSNRAAVSGSRRR